jgi:hypothetical protein
MTATTKVKHYRELRRLDTFEDRFDYLSLQGYVGESTFGYDRWINQRFYGSREWKQVRDFVILRDEGCDLGVDGYELHTGLLIHHMNPITPDAIVHGDEDILNPDYLITTSKLTHNAIHYGNKAMLKKPFVERSRNDTRLW